MNVTVSPATEEEARSGYVRQLRELLLETERMARGLGACNAALEGDYRLAIMRKAL